MRLREVLLVSGEVNENGQSDKWNIPFKGNWQLNDNTSVFFFHFTPLLLQLTTVSLKTNHITAYINDVLTEQ